MPALRFRPDRVRSIFRRRLHPGGTRRGSPAAAGLVEDTRGSVAVTIALSTTVLMGCAAFGIDLGVLFHAKRKAQSAADLAAMLAAADPSRADAVARRSLADNGYAAGATIAVVPGRYAASSQVAAAQRFQPGSAPMNAVRVNLRTDVRTTFSQVLGLPSRYEIDAAGTAASAQLTAFSIGSGLVGLDGGIANAVLGALLGVNLSLGAMDYNALLSARLDGYRFLGALGAQLRLASFEDVLAANVTVGDVLAAVKVASVGDLGLSAAGSAIDAILASGPTGSRFKLSDLIDLGDAGALGPASGTRGPTIGVMDLVSAAAGLANGDRQVSVDLGARIPGLLRTRLTLAIGERRQSSGWVQPGTANATVRTAQTRLLIEAGITAPLGLGTLTLPLYAEAAFARATLRSASCPWSASAGRQVTIEAQPGLLDLAIAEVPRSAIYADAAKPDLNKDATLVGLPLISVTGSARATLGSAYPQTLTFTEDDIANQRIKSIASTGLTTSLTRSLIDSLSLNVAGLGVGTALRPALQLTLSGVAPVLDAVLDNTLRTLGITVGKADLRVDGMRCDHAVLVQ